MKMLTTMQRRLMHEPVASLNLFHGLNYFKWTVAILVTLLTTVSSASDIKVAIPAIRISPANNFGHSTNLTTSSNSVLWPNGTTEVVLPIAIPVSLPLLKRVAFPPCPPNVAQTLKESLGIAKFWNLWNTTHALDMGLTTSGNQTQSKAPDVSTPCTIFAIKDNGFAKYPQLYSHLEANPLAAREFLSNHIVIGPVPLATLNKPVISFGGSSLIPTHTGDDMYINGIKVEKNKTESASGGNVYVVTGPLCCTSVAQLSRPLVDALLNANVPNNIQTALDDAGDRPSVSYSRTGNLLPNNYTILARRLTLGHSNEKNHTGINRYVFRSPAEVVPIGGSPSQYGPNNDSVLHVMPGLSGTSFLTLLQIADCHVPLSRKDPVTLFLPSDEAISNLPPRDLKTLVANPDRLKQALLHHIAPGTYTSDVFSGNMSITSIEGQPLHTDSISNGTLKTVEGAKVILSDIVGHNGVIHIIDRFLYPIPNGTLLDTLQKLPNSKRFLDLLKRVNLTDLLKGEEHYTVFAPTNDALNSISTSTPSTPEGNDRLRVILLNHLVPGIAYTASWSPAQILPTAGGHTVYLQYEPNESGGFSLLPNGATVSKSDIGATNGVIHIIDDIMPVDYLPTPHTPRRTFWQNIWDTVLELVGRAKPVATTPLATEGLPSEDDLVATLKKLPNAKYLLDALNATGLIPKLQKNGPYTIFVPVNSAFEHLGKPFVDFVDQNRTIAEKILLNHIVPNELLCDELKKINSANTLQGKQLTISPSEAGCAKVDNTEIIYWNITAKDGVIHLIDKVIFLDELPEELMPSTSEVPFYSTSEEQEATEEYTTRTTTTKVAEEVSELPSASTRTESVPFATSTVEHVSTVESVSTEMSPLTSSEESVSTATSTAEGASSVTTELPTSATSQETQPSVMYTTEGVTEVSEAVETSSPSPPPRVEFGYGLSPDEDHDIVNISTTVRPSGRGFSDLYPTSEIPVLYLPENVSDTIVPRPSVTFSTVTTSPTTLLDLLKQLNTTRFPSLLTDTQLDKTLSIQEPLTIFVPTDEAFRNVDSVTLNKIISDPEQLRRVLLYHVVPTRIMGNDLPRALQVGTLAGVPAFITVHVINQKPTLLVNNATILPVQHETDNTIVFLIDEVLVAPPEGDIFTTISKFLKENTTKDHIIKARLDPVLTGPGPLTMFVPTEKAWDRLPKNVKDQLATNTTALKEYILGHIVGGAIFTPVMAQGSQFTTLNGKTLTVTHVNGGIRINNGLIIQPDIVATNGVVHVIDDVFPIEELPSEITTLVTEPSTTPTPTIEQTTPIEKTIYRATEAPTSTEQEVTTVSIMSTEPEVTTTTSAEPETTTTSTEPEVATTTSAELETPTSTEPEVKTEQATEASTTEEEFPSTEAEVETTTELPPENVTSLPSVTEATTERLQPLLAVLRKQGLTKLAEYLDTIYAPKILNLYGLFTLFAPTNEAFVSLPPDDLKLLEDDPQALQQMLLYHAVSRLLPYKDITDRLEIPSIQGSNLTFNVYDNGRVKTVLGIEIIRPDIQVMDGIIHVIGKLLYPIPRTTTLETVDEQFPSFSSAITDSANRQRLKDKGVTAFIPSEEFWARTPHELREAIFSNLTLLNDVVKNHVCVGQIFKIGIRDGANCTTLSGRTLNFTVVDDHYYVNSVPIIRFDIINTDGIIHVIQSPLFLDMIVPEGEIVGLIPPRPTLPPPPTRKTPELTSSTISTEYTEPTVTWKAFGVTEPATVYEATLVSSEATETSEEYAEASTTTATATSTALSETTTAVEESTTPVAEITNATVTSYPPSSIAEEVTTAIIPTTYVAVENETETPTSEATTYTTEVPGTVSSTHYTTEVAETVAPTEHTVVPSYTPAPNDTISSVLKHQFEDAGYDIDVGKLNATLPEEQQYTAFFPNSIYLQGLPTDVLQDLIGNTTAVRDVFLNHICPGTIYSQTFRNDVSCTTIGGKPIAISVINGNYYANNFPIIQVDIPAADGVIHLISGILFVDYSRVPTIPPFEHTTFNATTEYAERTTEATRAPRVQDTTIISATYPVATGSEEYTTTEGITLITEMSTIALEETTATEAATSREHTTTTIETIAYTASTTESPETESFTPEYTTEFQTTYTGITENITESPEKYTTAAEATGTYPATVEESSETTKYTEPTTEVTVAQSVHVTSETSTTYPTATETSEYTTAEGATVEIVTSEATAESTTTTSTALSSATITTELTRTEPSTVARTNDTILSTFKAQFQEAGYDIDVTDLVNDIPDTQLYTAFLPHSVYLQELPSNVLQDLVKNNSAVRGVFINHICHGVTYSSQFQGGFRCTALSGMPIHITFQNEQYFCNNVPIIQVDIPALDGVIHLIHGFLTFEPQITDVTPEASTPLESETTTQALETTDRPTVPTVTSKARVFPTEETSASTLLPGTSVPTTKEMASTTTEVTEYEATTEIEGVTIVVAAANATMPVGAQVTEEVTTITAVNYTEATEAYSTTAKPTKADTSTVHLEVVTSLPTSTTTYTEAENGTRPSTILYIATEETESPSASTSVSTDTTTPEIFTTEVVTGEETTTLESTVATQVTTGFENITSRTTEIITTSTTVPHVSSETTEYTSTAEYQTSEESQEMTTVYQSTESSTTQVYPEVGNETSPTTGTPTSTPVHFTPAAQETILSAIKQLFESAGYDIDVTHLNESLPDTQTYTAFLPNSIYLQGLPSDVLHDLVTNRTAIRDVFVNNICPGVTYSSGFYNGFTCTSVGGKPLVVTVVDEKYYCNGFPIVQADIPAVDGVIHLLDGIVYFEYVSVTPGPKEESTVSVTRTEATTAQTTSSPETYTTIATSTEYEASTEPPTEYTTIAMHTEPTETVTIPTAETEHTESTGTTSVPENYTTAASTVVFTKETATSTTAYTEETATSQAAETTTLPSLEYTTANETQHTEVSTTAEYRTTVETTGEVTSVTPKEPTYRTTSVITETTETVPSEVYTTTEGASTNYTQVSTETSGATTATEPRTPENQTTEFVATTTEIAEYTTVEVSTPSPNETILSVIKQQFEDAGYDIDVRGLIPKLPPTQLYTLFLPYYVYLRGLPTRLIQDFIDNTTFVTETFVDHICRGAFYSSFFENGFTCTSIGDKPIVITSSNGRYYSNGFPIIRVDIPAADGVIHLLDGLLSLEHVGITPQTEKYTTTEIPKESSTVAETTVSTERHTTAQFTKATAAMETTATSEEYTFTAELPTSTQESMTVTESATQQATSEVSTEQSTASSEEYTAVEATEKTESTGVIETTTESVTANATTETPEEYTTTETEQLPRNDTIPAVLKQQFSRVGYDIDTTDLGHRLPSGLVFTACLPYSSYLLRIPQTVIYELINNKTFVGDLFANHVCNGALYSPQFGPGNSCISLGGKQINIRKYNGKYYCNNFPIVQADIPTVDGVVHLIDGLLFLESAGVTPAHEFTTTAFTLETATNVTTYAATESTETVETTATTSTTTSEAVTRPSKILNITEQAENYTQTSEVTEATTEYELTSAISAEATTETTHEEVTTEETTPQTVVNATEEEVTTSTTYSPVSANATTTRFSEEVTATEGYVTEETTEVTTQPEEHTTVETPITNKTIPAIIQTEFSKAGYDIDVSELPSKLPDRYLYTAFIPYLTVISRFPVPMLQDIIKNKTAVGDLFARHICPEATYSRQFANGYQCTSIDGNPIIVTRRNGTYHVNGIPIIELDIPAVDGVVHLINGFLFFEPRVETSPPEEYTTAAVETTHETSPAFSTYGRTLVTSTEELSSVTATEYETTTEIAAVTAIPNATMAVEAQVTEEVTTTIATTEYSTTSKETTETELSTTVAETSHTSVEYTTEAITEYYAITENVTGIPEVTTEKLETHTEILAASTETAESSTPVETTEGPTEYTPTTTKYAVEPASLPPNETILSAFKTQLRDAGHDINITELVHGLPDTQLYTAFLPYSVYLQGLPSQYLENVVNNNLTLRDVFLRHVCPGATYSRQFTDGFTCTAIGGNRITVTHEDGQFYCNGIPIIRVDIPALDGVMHLINGFLLLEPQVISSTPEEYTRHTEATESATLTSETPRARAFPTEEMTTATTPLDNTTVSTSEETVRVNVTMSVEAQVTENVTTTPYKEVTTVTEEYGVTREETPSTAVTYSEITEIITSTPVYVENATTASTEYPSVENATITYSPITEETTSSETQHTIETEASTERSTPSSRVPEIVTSVPTENVTETVAQTEAQPSTEYTELLNATTTTAEYRTPVETTTTPAKYPIPKPNDTIPSVIQQQFEDAGLTVDVTDLNATLPAGELYTAFLPYSVYLQGLPTDIVHELITNKTAVRDVFIDHICIGATFSRDFRNGFTCNAVGGQPLIVSIVNGKYYLNNYPIVQVDIPAADGVIHLLSGILHYKYGVTPPPLPLEHTTTSVTTEYPPEITTEALLTETATEPTEVVEYTFTSEEVTGTTHSTPTETTEVGSTLYFNVTEERATTTAYSELPANVTAITTTEHAASVTTEGYEVTTSTEVTTEAVVTEEGMTSTAPSYGTTKYPEVFNITTEEVSPYSNATEVTSVSTLLPTSTSYPEIMETTVIPFYPAPEGRGLLSVSIFFYLIDLADVDQILSHGGPYTILAPVDSAFSGLPPQVMRKLEDEPMFLKEVILYHILPKKIGTTELLNDNLLTTLQGQDVRCNIYGPVITIGGARVILPDSDSGYGVLHIVNKVLYPLPNGTALDTLQPRNDTDRVQNLIRNTTLPRRLQEPGAYTVFIPSDRALSTLPSSVIDALEKNSSLLEEFVLNHMVNGTYYTEGMGEGLELTSMGGQLLRISMAGGLTVNGVPIVNPDISVTNGVIHIIDRILYNPVESVTIPKIEPIVRNDLNVVQLSRQLNLTTFTDLLSTSGLSVNLSEPGPYTLFAPTNEAFAEMPPSQLEGIQSNPDKLQQLLLYHVLPVRLLTTHVTNEMLVPSLVPAKRVRMNIYVNNHGPWYTASGSQILRPNNVASNGIVHVVHQVLYIPLGDIVQTVEKCSILQTLRHVITVSGLTDDIRVGNYTLLAPNDAAFNKLPEDVVQRLLVDPIVAKAFLLGHLLRGTVNTDGIFDESTMNTVSNSEIYVRALKDCILLNSAAIQYPDVTADNGVVHVIDRVLQVNY